MVLPMQTQRDKDITSIQQVIDIIEEMLEPLTDIDERRPLIDIIKFCQRQQDAGRKLEDIIWWLHKGMPDLNL